MATFTAASTSRADVQAAMDLATGAGDTVQIPAGSSAWTAKVSWTNSGGILLGAGSLSTTGGGDSTAISDNYNANDKLLDVNGLSRMAGITFQSGTATTPKDGGTLRFGSSTSLRIDHCHFDFEGDANYQGIYLGGGVRGVMDHCICDFTTDNLIVGIYPFNGRSSGVGDAQGNYEWTQPTAFGTNDFFFIEDNIITCDRIGGGAYPGRIWDGFTAAKVVARFNTLAQCCINEVHATGHSPGDRGSRAQESYGNLITSTLAKDPNFCMSDLSSGCALVWGNNCANAGSGVFKNIYYFNVTRKNADTYNQTATPNGWGYAGTQFNGTGSNWDGGTSGGTDTVRGYPCLDMPGRGVGQLITGDFPTKTNASTGTIAWPNQALEPIYIWANVGAIVSGWGGNTYSDNTLGRVVANRDYYPQASGIQVSASSPFDGTVGTGWGTLANRPTTCTTGVAYWATDQGSWNQSSSNPYGVQQNGADGVLYVATSTNTWTLYYTPYTYPHPLQGGGGGAVTAGISGLVKLSGLAKLT